MSDFEDDFKVASDLLAEVFGTTVTITRSAVTTASVTAESYTHEFQVQSEDGFGTILHVRDFVIDVADYTHAGSAVKPRAGDVITETIAGTEHEFTVAAPPGMPAAQWTDTDGGKWVVHTKRTK